MAAKEPAQIGPFRIVRRLGAGGMAEAFVGMRTGPGGFEQQVCVKRVLPSYGGDDEFVRLFLREARLAAVLSHRNITRVLEFGQDASAYYLALELVDGTDLRHVLKSRPDRRLSPQVSALVGMEIADALAHAHSRRGTTGAVVHRDVSPANILVSRDGDVKLTDFGISKALGDVLASRSEFVRGNVWYMAPEQLRLPGFADPRSDLYSLGVVLFQCLAGQRPYEGPTDLSAMMALSEGRRMHLADIEPGIDDRLATIVERLLAQEPEDRFQSAREASDTLARLVDTVSARAELRELVNTTCARKAAPVPTEATITDLAQTPSDESATCALGRRARAPTPVSEVAPPDPASTSGSWKADAASLQDAAPPQAAVIVPPARWAPYNYAPGVWASAQEAARMRAADQPRLPLNRPLWPYILAGVLLGVVLAVGVALLRS